MGRLCELPRPAKAGIIGSLAWLRSAIRKLPSDEAVPLGTPGYNKYPTQKAHWLGWLDTLDGRRSPPSAGKPERTAHSVYNHIKEPKMLLWLVTAAEVDAALVMRASIAAGSAISLLSRSAAIRRIIPWATVSASIIRREKAAD